MAKKKKQLSFFQGVKDIEKTCKRLGIPYSENRQPSGTASIRFMTRLKSEEKKEK